MMRAAGSLYGAVKAGEKKECAGSCPIDRGRYRFLDGLRGLTLVSMIGYHAVWDMVYLFGRDWTWFYGTGAHLWQQSIAWTFIFLSGFCFSLGRRPIRRGLTVLLWGCVISAVTSWVMPDNPVRFGILTLLGSCMIMTALLKRMLVAVPGGTGFAASTVLFFLTRPINGGWIGGLSPWVVSLPGEWYGGPVGTWLGFPAGDFVSADYFSLFPWGFLYLCGFYMYRLAEKTAVFQRRRTVPLGFTGWLGRHSLTVYLVHQPVLYGIFSAVL